MARIIKYKDCTEALWGYQDCYRHGLQVEGSEMQFTPSLSEKPVIWAVEVTARPTRAQWMDVS